MGLGLGARRRRADTPRGLTPTAPAAHRGSTSSGSCPTAHPAPPLLKINAPHQRETSPCTRPRPRRDGTARARPAPARRAPTDPTGRSPRPIHRALESSRRQKQRAHLPQIAIHDRLAARETERLDQLPDPHPRQLGIPTQKLVDLLLERVELRRRRRPLIPRRRLRTHRQPYRIRRKARPARQLLDRDPTNEMFPAHFRPPLHVQHNPSPGLGDMTEPGSRHPRTPPPPPEGGQHSTGEGGSVFHRRRHQLGERPQALTNDHDLIRRFRVSLLARDRKTRSPCRRVPTSEPADHIGTPADCARRSARGHNQTHTLLQDLSYYFGLVNSRQAALA